MFKESVSRRAKEFKTLLYKWILASDERINQDAIAFHLEIDPSGFNHYLNPDIERNLPAFQTKRLPREIRVAFANWLIEDINGRIVVFGDKVKLDGKIDDEILLVGMLEGRLIERKDKSPEEINKVLDELQIVVDRMRAETAAKKK